MKTMRIHFLKNIFFYFMIVAVVIVGAIAYYRFVVKWDYIVEYEGICDPATNDCFIYCEDDDECYYYSIKTKYAPDLYSQCGEDITDCESAEVCFPNDRNCSTTYCDIETDGDDCEMLTKEELEALEAEEEIEEIEELETVEETEDAEEMMETEEKVEEAVETEETEGAVIEKQTDVKNDDEDSNQEDLL